VKANQSGKSKSFERGGKTVTDSAPLRTNRVPKSGKRGVRFRDLVEPALEAKRSQGNEASSIHTDRVRLRRILPAIGHLNIGTLTAGGDGTLASGSQAR
jgi:hypothetical protein